MKPAPVHIDTKIESFLDKELSPAENDAVQEHCATCPVCERLLKEQIAVRKMLAGVTGSEPIRPMWNGVRERLIKSEPQRLKSAFALGATAAAVGVCVGLFVGSLQTHAPEMESSNLWSNVGSTITGETDELLPSLYLNTSDEEGS
ncbi:MAG: zf-HC2 domain-containing protein [Candidatus Eisenbacteria bacterium]|uniref:Zf-HC2 domain-containing protein n=1 Tax=Eiseniibacteriota bacterium TaxID=2212470 RepID=A0A948RZE0_UNCEI|nr:zf-HC2 domain-containing protein [Candidatus Eisenbacteria bacterium]MBU1949932.1 zf-HC2 domain-containing protein [Candidatus Eisenbacteria bacterium]MBU2692776.1 zf-HC2 domain-containing protein [Candidatus Eisenbacteria bacterium]